MSRLVDSKSHAEIIASVRIPQRLKKRPKYHGMAIPYTTWIHPVTGIPDFKVNDEKRRLCVIRDRGCAMCGERMNELICFIGGSEGICDGKLFIDAGMHPACARYAWQVCPYIVYGRTHAPVPYYEGAVIHVFRDAPISKPTAMGLLTTNTYQPVVVINEEDGTEDLFVKAGPPVQPVEWKH